MRTGLLPGVLGLFTALAVAGSGQAPRFKITTRRADDRVEVRAEKAKTLFTVKSPFGIGQAVLERLEDHWPDPVALRLHLKGLSSLRLSAGTVRLDAAVSVQDGKQEVRQWKDGREEAPLGEKSPFWMHVRVVGEDGRPARQLPLKGGYFEVLLPRALFAGNPKSLTVNWIDFYR